MVNITQRFVENAGLPPSRSQVIYRDADLTGFGLRVTPGGKCFVVEARVNGKSRRITVGRADLLSVDEARKQAICLLAQMTAGIDPQVEKHKQQANLITFGTLTILMPA